MLRSQIQHAIEIEKDQLAGFLWPRSDGRRSFPDSVVKIGFLILLKRSLCLLPGLLQRFLVHLGSVSRVRRPAN